MKDIIIGIGQGLTYTAVVWLVFYIAIASVKDMFQYND